MDMYISYTSSHKYTLCIRIYNNKTGKEMQKKHFYTFTHTKKEDNIFIFMYDKS